MSHLSPSHPLLRKALVSLITIAVLLGCALVTRPLEAPAWKVVKTAQVESNLKAVALGQGLVVGTLGGFRTVLADFAWLRLYQVWLTKERAELDATIRLVTTLDPRPEFFWISGARMLAYDVPAWRIQAEGGYFDLPERRQREIDREQAEQAFALLHRALEFHPDSPGLCLEIGQIYMNRLKDDAKAAEWYLKASKFPDAPYYAARVYAELLRRQGKTAEGYAFLKERYYQLEGAPFPQQEIVLDRIQYFEELLEVPVAQRFRP